MPQGMDIDSNIQSQKMIMFHIELDLCKPHYYLNESQPISLKHVPKHFGTMHASYPDKTYLIDYC